MDEVRARYCDACGKRIPVGVRPHGVVFDALTPDSRRFTLCEACFGTVNKLVWGIRAGADRRRGA